MEFSGSEITELAVNMIAESMYTQCDVDGNEYLLLEVLIDHRKNDSALGVEDQKAVKGERPLESQQLVGTFVTSRKMAPHHGRCYLILKSCTQFRLPKMLDPRALRMNQPVIGGFTLSSRKVAR